MWSIPTEECPLVIHLVAPEQTTVDLYLVGLVQGISLDWSIESTRNGLSPAEEHSQESEFSVTLVDSNSAYVDWMVKSLVMWTVTLLLIYSSHSFNSLDNSKFNTRDRKIFWGEKVYWRLRHYRVWLRHPCLGLSSKSCSQLRCFRLVNWTW